MRSERVNDCERAEKYVLNGFVITLELLASTIPSFVELFVFVVSAAGGR
jgi:hypothetical protein